MADYQSTETSEQTPEQRKNFVTQWCARVKAAKKFHEPAFTRMRKDMDFAYLGADGEWIAGGNYVANIIQRHINNAVAALYAKNPRASAKRRPRLDFKLWDGDAMSLEAAKMSMSNSMATGIPDLNAMALLQEIDEVKTNMLMLDRMGKTTEILFHYFLDEQEPRFKPQMKQAVRRAKVTGIAYVELGFQRILEPQPDITARINDVTDQIARMERLMQEYAEGEIESDAAELEELRALIEELQSKENIIAREGPVFLFPRSTVLIPDPKCTSLPGFIGADWVAKEHTGSPERVKEIYKVDLGKDGEKYRQHKSSKLSKFEAFMENDSKDSDGEGKQGSDQCVWWRVMNKATGQEFTIADGYHDFLKAPAAPDVKLERFWPWFPLTFNDLESEKEVFPRSDVSLLRDMQEEYNRSRQGLREHRRANRPKYFVGKGMLSQTDRDNLQSHPNSAIIELSAIQPGQNVEQLIMAHRPVPLDPALYDTNPLFEDVLRVVGAQEANIGGLSGSTATEASIGESSRMSTQSSDVDNLDETLTEVARATGQIMLLELSSETAVEIAGPGAVWPELTRDEIVKELRLDIKAGSSGRPNRAAEIANLERLTPLALQVPGIAPDWLAGKVVEAMDEGVSLEEALMSGVPSITAINTMARGTAAQPQPGTGDPATDPGQQGGHGGDVNTQKDVRTENGPQPAYPTPLTTM